MCLLSVLGFAPSVAVTHGKNHRSVSVVGMPVEREGCAYSAMRDRHGFLRLWSYIRGTRTQSYSGTTPSRGLGMWHSQVEPQGFPLTPLDYLR